MEIQKYALKVSIRAPFLFPSEGVGRYGYDCVTLRNAAGFPVVPRDQVRGLIRHGLQALCDAGNTEAKALLRAFGGAGRDAAPLRNSQDEEQEDLEGTNRGRIYFDDLVADHRGEENLPPIPRVEIERESGAAVPGHLAQFEQVARPGTVFEFSGNLAMYAEPNEDWSDLFALALSWHGSIGAMKSVGFGEVDFDKSGCAKRDTTEATCNAPSSEKLTWRFTLDRPYLVDAERLAANAYRGRPDIPGGALKGLLAKHLKLTVGMDGSLSEALSNLVISFARTSKSVSKLPLSVMFRKTNASLVDMVADGVSTGDLVWHKDWKDTDQLAAAIARFASAHPQKQYRNAKAVQYESRMHSAIDAQSGAVEEAKLFSTQAVLPVDEFEAVVSFSNVASGNRQALMQALNGTMLGLGRTDASLTTVALSSSEAVSDEQEGCSIPEAGDVALCLATPALMVDHADAALAFDAYAHFWSQHLPNSKLIAAFSEERIVGGYLGYRFGEKGKYRPYLLTEAGSVFHIQLSQTDVASLNGLLSSGICRTELHGQRLGWRNCPFVTENGYGSIAVHNAYKDEESDSVS